MGRPRKENWIRHGFCWKCWHSWSTAKNANSPNHCPKCKSARIQVETELLATV